jgi:hypothetical protein
VYVGSHLTGYDVASGVAVSEHVIRIIPDPEEIDPGYLYALLPSRVGTILLNQGNLCLRGAAHHTPTCSVTSGAHSAAGRSAPNRWARSGKAAMQSRASQQLRTVLDRLGDDLLPADVELPADIDVDDTEEP